MLPGLGSDKRLKSVTFHLTCTVFAALLWVVGMTPASSILVGLAFDLFTTIRYAKE